MPDKKPTDNEIKKALEYCSKQGITSECEKCKMPKNTCRTELIGYAFDLINRQQAENERLKKSNRNWRRKVQRLRAKAKAEAYKKCAEKIKQKTLAMIYSPDEISTDDYIKCIDDVVKELDGEN